jgi:hypothetical protein
MRHGADMNEHEYDLIQRAAGFSLTLDAFGIADETSALPGSAI